MTGFNVWWTMFANIFIDFKHKAARVDRDKVRIISLTKLIEKSYLSTILLIFKFGNTTSSYFFSIFPMGKIHFFKTSFSKQTGL